MGSTRTMLPVVEVQDPTARSTRRQNLLNKRARVTLCLDQTVLEKDRKARDTTRLSNFRLVNSPEIEKCTSPVNLFCFLVWYEKNYEMSIEICVCV